MPPVGDARTEAAPDTAQVADAAAAPASSFRFIPRELAIKCRRLIESYHAIYGYVGLPDMLWLSDARDIIERDRELTRIFKRAARSRAAKRANDSFLHIATTIVSLEVLARDFSGWGKRFPAAKCEAEKILGPPAATAAHLADGSLLLSAARRPSRVRRYPHFLPHRNAPMSAAPRRYSAQRAHDCRLFRCGLPRISGLPKKAAALGDDYRATNAHLLPLAHACRQAAPGTFRIPSCPAASRRIGIWRNLSKLHPPRPELAPARRLPANGSRSR